MVRNQLLEFKRVLVFSCEEAGEYFSSRLKTFWPELSEEMLDGFMLDDSPSIDIETILLSVLYYDKVGFSPDIVYIDQLNKITISDFKGNKHERIVAVSEQLQGLVKKIKRPVVVLHQANRESENNSGFMTQANVSDADAVFNESQVLLFLESRDFFEWNRIKEPANKVEFNYFINIGKNRTLGGFKGAIPCVFDRSTGIFLPQDSEILRKYHNAKGFKQIK
jgi:hypothetical protein